MEEPNPIQMTRTKSRGIAIFTVWILTLALAAFSFGANQDVTEAKIDYGMAQQDILKFEQVIGKLIGSTFSASSFAVVQKPKGAYVPGYGISLSFLINIHRAVINTPFGQIQKAATTPDLKKRLIEELKEKLIMALQENADFRQLRKQDCVAIIAFFEDRNFPDEPNANTTIVMSASKKDLDELGNKSDRLKEFKQRMKIVEY